MSMKLEGEITYQKAEHSSPSDAFQNLMALKIEVRTQMAQIYKDAFGGYPWFEVFICSKCSNFSPQDAECPYCGGADFSEAYPLEDLIENYFPEMVMAYAPGVLILAENEDGEVEGFSAGGGVKIGDLIAKKYRGDESVLNSILTQSGLTEDAVVFYENETCISPNSQKKGMGGNLNFERLLTAKEQGFQYIAGRSVNQPWLKLKERQMDELGYDFVSFIPEGDEYEIDGQRRYFFVGIRREE